MQQISKHRIVPGFNKRERPAENWVCEHYYAPVYAIVKRITKGGPATEDLVSDTFLTLLARENSFENLRKLESFLYATARNISMDHLRHQSTVLEKSGHINEYLLAKEEERERASDLSAAFYHLIKLAEASLPERCKEVFMLCYIEELKNKAIAQRLNVKVKTVANLKLRAYEILRKELNASGNLSLMDFLGTLLL